MANYWEEDDRVAEPTGHLPRKGVAAPAPKQSPTSHYQEVLYREFLNQGLSHEGAKTMVAHIGRENSFQPQHLFGTHRDPANGRVNAGMISWQNDRGHALTSFMGKRGLLDEQGNIVRTDDALRAQVQFMMDEMGSKPKWRNVRNVLSDTTKGYGDMEAIVGDDYVAWRRTDPKYSKSGYARQNEFYRQISDLADGGHLQERPATDSGVSHPISPISPAAPRRPIHPSPAMRVGGPKRPTPQPVGNLGLPEIPARFRRSLGTRIAEEFRQLRKPTPGGGGGW